MVRLPPPAAVLSATQREDEVNTDTHVLIVTQYLASLQQGWMPYSTGANARKVLSEGELRRLKKLGAYSVEVAWVTRGRSLGRIVGNAVQFNIFELLELYNRDKSTARLSTSGSNP